MALARQKAAAMVILLLSGCATYRAAPLPSPESILSPGMPTRISARQDLTHPLIPARPIDLKAPLTDLDAARLALVSSPDLAATRTRAGVSEAQLFAAGLIADPQLSLSLERPSGLGLVDAIGAGLSFDLAALVTRRARIEGAEHSLAQTRLDIAWSEWLALNHVRTLVRRFKALEKQIAVADQAEDVAQEIYRLTERNMKAGDARLDDATVYQVGYLDAQDRLFGLKRQLAAAQQELNAVVGVPPQARLALLDLQAPASLDEAQIDVLVARAARERLDLQALKEGYAAQERGVRAEARSALPLPQLSVNRARDTGGIWTRGAGISMGLPLWNRNRGAISIALATREQLAAEYRARVIQTRSDIATQVEDLRAIDAQRRALADELPTLEQSAKVILQATREGSLPLVTYETVRASLLDKQLTLFALEQAQLEGEVALETSAGHLLWEAP